MQFGESVATSTDEIVDLFASYFESIYVKDGESDESKEVQVSLFDIESEIQKLK